MCFNLLDNGFSLITVSDDKRPNIKWKEYQTAPMSKNAFENFYNMGNSLGVGIVTGYNNLEVIDVDLKVLPSAREKESFWNEFLGILKDNIYDFDSKFLIVKTRNAGYHIVYRTDLVAGNIKIARSKYSPEALIESRGRGGYVWIYENFVNKNSYNDVCLITDEDREILWECCKIFNYVEQSGDANIPTQTKKEYEPQGIKCWDDYNAKTNIWELIKDDFKPVKYTSLGELVVRNGGTHSHSGIIFKNSGYLYLHSTGTIYPSEKLLTPFCVFAYKYHNGNFSEAAKALYHEGFGERIKKNINKEVEPTALPDEYDFPIDVFPKNIQDYLFELNTKLNSSIDFMGTSLLYVLSMCIGNAVKVEVKKGWLEPAIIWAAIVGKAGVGKTHNIDNIVKPLIKLNERELHKYKEAMQRFKEYSELDKAEKKNRAKVDEPTSGQFIVGDVTFEKLISMHEKNKKGIGILRDELTAWIKDLNKYRPGSDLENYLSAFSGKPIIKNRVTAEDNYVAQSFLSILGGVQPAILSMHYTTENKDNGLIDRILLCYPKITIEYFNDNEIDQEWLDWYNDFIIMLKDNLDKLITYTNTGQINSKVVLFSPDARNEFKRVLNGLTDIENGDFESDYIKNIIPKQKTYLARFALMLNILYWHNEEGDFNYISKRSVMSAEKLVNYFMFMAKKNKFETTEKNEIKELVKKTGKVKTKEKFLQAYEDDKTINITKLCELLGVSRASGHKWIKDYEKKV